MLAASRPSGFEFCNACSPIVKASFVQKLKVTHPLVHRHAVVQLSRPLALRSKAVIDANDNDPISLADHPVDRIVHEVIAEDPSTSMGY